MQFNHKTSNTTFRLLAWQLYRTKSRTLSCLSTSIFKQQDWTLAQQYIQTIKYRNLVTDLGNGVKTNAQLTVPAIRKGPKTDLNPQVKQEDSNPSPRSSVVVIQNYGRTCPIENSE